MIELVLGGILAIAFILFAKYIKVEKWIYSASLLALPIVYMGFAWGHGSNVALAELAAGTPYILAGIVFSLYKPTISEFIIGLLWLTHGTFDVIHDNVIENPGVPAWYPGLCAGYDAVVGSYLLNKAYLKWKHA